MLLSLRSKITVALAFALGCGGLLHLVNANATSIAVPAPLTALPPQPNGVPYPTKSWQRQALPSDTSAKLNPIIDKAFNGQIPEIGETRALLIVKGGKIIVERYGVGFDAESKLLSWSMAKSITSAVFGAMLGDGKVTYETPIADPHWRETDDRYKITYGQALRMTDGLNWRESDYSQPTTNDAAIMLFGDGREDIVKYVTTRPKKYKAGEVWNYSSGTTNLIAAGLSRKMGPRTIEDPTGKERFREYLFDRIFLPIGMNNTAAEFDASGNFYGSSLVYASAQDFARFGLLFLRGGVWDGKAILPRSFVDYVRTPTLAKGATEYGAHWWLSTENHRGFLKNGPYDSFEARGHEGQVILVIPSKDMVVVRLGLMDHEQSWDKLGEYLSQVIAAIP
ncbi:MAG: beta-lactamase [Hyphomonadaceae bacterium]|nr:MAG: beta-lactamase [Hyphomonadaceae bacterium]KAF0187093.1 MAG: beta-lactamase [Hyphomonadaceae bacterium]